MLAQVVDSKLHIAYDKFLILFRSVGDMRVIPVIFPEHRFFHSVGRLVCKVENCGAGAVLLARSPVLQK